MSIFDSFKKKAAGSNDTNSESPPENKQTPVGSPKKKSELAKVLDESVWESVHEDLKQNKQFIIKNDMGETQYVALLFDTNDIGGLAGKAARKDESKGSIIEAIRMGRIKTYIRTEMLLDDCFVIIPDAKTIENMDEFRVLVGANYILCTVTPDGAIETVTENGQSDGKDYLVTYDQIKKLINSKEDVKTIFPSKKAKTNLFNNSAQDSEDVRETVEETPFHEPAVSEADQGEDIEDLPTEMLNESPEDFDTINQQISNTQPLSIPNTPVAPVQPQPVQSVQPAQQVSNPAIEDEEQFDFGVAGDDTISDPMPDDDYFEDEYEEITEETVQDFVTRTFYSDDLGLEVSSMPFDVQFVQGNPYIPFDENRGSGWLNEHLSNIAKDGNVRMQRLHTENLWRLREKYMRLIQAHCENIAKSLDITSEDNQYGRLRFAIDTNKDENEKALKETIRPRIEQLERNWQATLKRIGDSAAADAIRMHEERYGSQHKADIMNLEAHERDEIERDYQNAIRRLNEDRRAEATKLLDIAINTTLKELADVYLRVLQEEKKEYIRIQNEIIRFTDENRKSEIARIDALSEENRQSNKAEEVRREYAAKIKVMAAEFESKTAALQAEVRQMRIDHDNELRLRMAEYDDKVKGEQNKTEDIQKRFDELLNKYSSLEEAKNKEYADRIQRLKDENDSFKDELEHVSAVHKRSNKIAIYLVIVAVIAAIGAGFMLGSILNVRRASQAEQDALSKVQQDTSYVSNSPASDTTSDSGGELINYGE